MFFTFVIPLYAFLTYLSCIFQFRRDVKLRTVGWLGMHELLNVQLLVAIVLTASL